MISSNLCAQTENRMVTLQRARIPTIQIFELQAKNDREHPPLILQHLLPVQNQSAAAATIAATAGFFRSTIASTS